LAFTSLRNDYIKLSRKVCADIQAKSFGFWETLSTALSTRAPPLDPVGAYLQTPFQNPHFEMRSDALGPACRSLGQTGRDTGTD